MIIVDNARKLVTWLKRGVSSNGRADQTPSQKECRNDIVRSPTTGSTDRVQEPYVPLQTQSSFHMSDAQRITTDTMASYLLPTVR
jgi:hypothetical protein